MKSTVIIIYNEYMSLHTYTGESKYTFLVSISIKVFSFWTKYPNFYIKQLLCNNYIKQVYDITHNSLIHPVATNAIKECVITRILQRNRHQKIQHFTIKEKKLIYERNSVFSLITRLLIYGNKTTFLDDKLIFCS